MISNYYTKTESDNLYCNTSYIHTLLSGYYTRTESDIGYYNNFYIDSDDDLKHSLYTEQEIDDKFQTFNTAFTFARGPSYYNLPTNLHGILIWDTVTETPKVTFKLTLSKFYTDIEMTGDLKASRLSGHVLTQIETMISNNCYSKSQFDTTVATYYTKPQTDNLLLPSTTDRTNVNRVIYRTLGWTGGLVIKYPQLGALRLNAYLDEVTAFFDVNDSLFSKLLISLLTWKLRVMIFNVVH